MLGHEDLAAYRQSIDLLAAAARIGAKIPEDYAPLRDQIGRSSASIPVRIADGATRGRIRRRHLQAARRAALELGAVLDTCLVLEIVPELEHAETKRILLGLVGGLGELGAGPAAAPLRAVRQDS